jgi:hypothetical protein
MHWTKSQPSNGIVRGLLTATASIPPANSWNCIALKLILPKVEEAARQQEGQLKTQLLSKKSGKWSNISLIAIT